MIAFVGLLASLPAALLYVVGALMPLGTLPYSLALTLYNFVACA